MYIEQAKPEYLTCDQAIWNKICRRQTLSLSSVAYSVILEYSSVRFDFLFTSLVLCCNTTAEVDIKNPLPF